MRNGGSQNPWAGAYRSCAAQIFPHMLAAAIATKGMHRTFTKPAMTHRPDFAPVSNTESSLLRFGAGYFMLNGVIYGVMVATVLVAYALGSLPFAPTLSTFVNILVPIAMAVGLFWTGMLLGRRSRLGGWLALGFTIMPFAFAALTPYRPDTFTVVLTVLGVIALALVWRDLR